jgi:SNF2 family DNA or RNA helicase
MFKIFIHHGANRLTTLSEIRQYDIVITTYGTLMQGYRSIEFDHADSSEQQSTKEKGNEGARKGLLGRMD